VETTAVPFDISAEFIPDLLRKPDKELERLSAGLAVEAPEFKDIIHQSAEMRRVIAMARRVAARSIPVLIEGESGTGKELLARAIHRSSLRRSGPLITINCGAIAPELVESELFGHEKGAFTGATSRRIGHFEEANGGSLFLDELGELQLPMQVKLLRAIQEGEITRVGSSKPTKLDVRLIAATNRTLINDVAEGSFREDLFYRLAVAVIQLPPLRERKGDKGLLIEHCLKMINQESASEPGFKEKKLSAAGKNLLLRHDWPGNVRELINTLRRAVVWSSGSVIDEDDVRSALLPVRSPGSDDILNKTLGDGFKLRELLDEIESHYLKRAMAEAQGNKKKATELLGLANYQTVSSRLLKHGLVKG
jgi:transcriptional regulator with PAS, ATPase and Fis domain